jgi:uncharacterized protein (TIGR02996 family)
MVMSDHQAFLQGILQHPDDDAPRQVYADWLEERADPRGEFIRVQCALAKLPVDDPQWAYLEQREWDLLRAHEAEWMKDIQSIVSDWTFHRGFVDTVSLGARAFVDDGAKLVSRAPIRRVKLTRLGTSSVSGKELAECPQLAQLHGLEIKGEMPVSDLKALLLSPNLKRLVALSLPSSPGEMLQTLSKSGPSSLEELNVSGMLGASRQFKLLTGKLPFALKKLNLAQTGLASEEVQQVAAASGLGSLTHLDVSDNSGLRVAGAHALARSPVLTQLRFLGLGRSTSAFGGCQIGLKGTEALATSATLSKLTSLDLRDNNLADSAMSAIVASPHWNRLRELWLGSNKLTSKGIDALVKWSGLGQLQVLDFWVNYGIGDPGAQRLAESPGVANLLHLDLGYTTLTPKGVQALTQSSHLKRLRHLNIEGNKIGDAGVTTLVKSPVVVSLRVLNLARTGMKDSSAKAIIASPHLQHLRKLKLNGNKLTNTSKKALEERFGSGVCEFGQQ